MISKTSETGKYPARGVFREVAAFDVLLNNTIGPGATTTYAYATPGVLPGDLVVMMFKPAFGFAQEPSSDLNAYKVQVSTPGIVTIYAQNIDSTASRSQFGTYRITVLRKE